MSLPLSLVSSHLFMSSPCFVRDLFAGLLESWPNHEARIVLLVVTFTL